MTWIGGNSLAQDRVYVWDGLVKSDMRSYSDWAPSDPTNIVHLGENCMVMHHSGSFKCWMLLVSGRSLLYVKKELSMT